MKLSEAIETMNGGVRIGDFAKSLHVKKETLGSILSEYKFTYNYSTKRWDGGAAGVNPQEIDLLELISQRRKRRKNPSSRVNSRKNEKSSPTDSPKDEPISHMDSLSGEMKFIQTNEMKFTQEQFEALVQMANERLHRTAEESKREALHSRIMALKTESKTRKTIVIDSSIGSKFDDFAARSKLNKSDLIALALSDFMDIYK